MAFAVLILLLLARGSWSYYDRDLEDRILDTIQGVVDIVANQSEPLVDAYFGLALAEVQMTLLLDWVWNQGVELCPVGLRIAETEAKLRKALQANEEKRDTQDPIWFLIQPELWQIPHQSKQLPLRKLKCNEPVCSPTSKKYEDLYNFATYGTPQEDESDDCIYGLLRDCTVSERCLHFQTSMNPPPHGYPLTHRLLFLQIARQLNCVSTPFFANIDIGATTRLLCERILADSNVIKSWDYPLLLQDLFTEQLVLCGIESFQEFMTLEWTEKLLSWKLPSGCFPDEERLERTDMVVGDSCSLHFSGLAAAALSIALRNLLENMKFYDCTEFKAPDRISATFVY